jgi:hypothetical protein
MKTKKKTIKKGKKKVAKSPKPSNANRHLNLNEILENSVKIPLI